MYTINLFALTANIFKMFCTNVVKKITFICGIEIMSFYCAPQWSILFFAPLLDVSKPWMPTFRGLGWDGAYQDYMSCLVIWCGATMLRRRTQVWRALIKRWICLTKTCNWSKNLVMQCYKKILIYDSTKPLKFESNSEFLWLLLNTDWKLWIYDDISISRICQQQNPILHPRFLYWSPLANCYQHIPKGLSVFIASHCV